MSEKQERGVKLVLELLRDGYAGVAWEQRTFGSDWVAIESSDKRYCVLVNQNGACTVNSAPWGERNELTTFLRGRPGQTQSYKFFRPREDRPVKAPSV